MEKLDRKYVAMPKKLLILGFGSIGQAVLPLIFRHIDIKPTQIIILSKKHDGEDIAQKYGISFNFIEVTKENYLSVLNQYLQNGDFLLNLSVDISSIDLIKFCRSKEILYLDTCIEPWAGGYINNAISASLRSNYALREETLSLKKDQTPTAVITHGANPGLVSHFVKQALLNMAVDNGLNVQVPVSQQEWAHLSYLLNIKVIHIAERDTQITNQPKRRNEFVNTWSIDGFIGEGSQPSELGWGSHERHWPHDAHQHSFGCQSAIYLERPGASIRVRTWTPMAGPFHGFLITHGESISIANYLTFKKDEEVLYRPTVHYAYHPCDDAVLSLHELAGCEWHQQHQHRLLSDDIVEGVDELGVLLMGNARGAYWYGSQLSIDEARKLAPYNTATSLQVAAGVLAGMIWAIENPRCSVVEPDEINYKYILDIANPYLGKMVGEYTTWTPLENRARLFAEEIDYTDPWQFRNIRVF